MKMNNSGQSLIEVLIALTMMTLLLAGLVIATTQSVKNSRFARDQVRATNLAKKKMEGLRDYRDEHSWSDFLTTQRGTRTSTETIDGVRFTITSTITEIADNEAGVVVTVSWEDRGTHQVEQKTTLSKWAY